MGIREGVRDLHRTRRGPTALSQAVQLQPTARLPRQTSAGLEAEQPRWELQLADALALLLLIAVDDPPTAAGASKTDALAFAVLCRRNETGPARSRPCLA